MKRRNHLLASTILVLCTALFASPAAAQIAFVKTIATNATNTTGTSIAVTVPAAGVAAGNSIIVSFAMNPATGTVSCADTASNSYGVDRDVVNGSGTSGVRTVILSADNVIALASGNTITCTHPSVAARAVSANEFSGLAVSAARDQTAGAIGSSMAPSSGSTPTTAQAVELLIGAIGVEGKSNETFTPGSSYTTIGRAGTNQGNAATNITINPEYRIVTATGAYAATATLGNSRAWAAAIATYKAKVAATKLAITSVNSGVNPIAGQTFSLVVQSQKADGTPVLVVNPTAFNLSVASGGGNLASGTTSGTIPGGTNQVTVSGVLYSKADLGVILRGTQTSGDPVSPGDSAPFTVNAGNPTKLAFINQPVNSTTSGAIKGPPTVAVQDSAGNTIATSTAAVTIAIGTNPGGGTLSGTTVKNASSGVSAFADLHINQAANGYTLTATSPGLTSATSATFNIVAAGSMAGTVTKASGGGAITGALVEALQSGVVKGTGSTNSSGNYSITGLIPGAYDIRGTAGGFSPQTQTGVTVNAGATATTNFSLVVSTPTAGIVYIYDELQRLKSVIDPVGEAATYSYDAVGNLLGITRNNSSQTSIIDFNPNSGAVGSSVTIYGSGYSATPSQNTVTFNGVAATVVSSTLTQIVTTVPAGATTGPIAVTSPAGSATSATNFTVTGSPAGAPTIASFTPTIGNTGTALSITGANFDTTPANNEVRFNPTLAVVNTATSTNISTTIPVAARSGKISVSTAAGTAFSTQDFYKVPPSYSAADVEFTGRMSIGGSSLAVTINSANKLGLVIFDGISGQRVSLGVSGFAIGETTIKIYRPDGTNVLAQFQASSHLQRYTESETQFRCKRLLPEWRCHYQNLQAGRHQCSRPISSLRSRL
ncbi:MAG: hypothetical protein HW419_582 [Deltaproteobacteria bacterium]|nr:hypothetical protein [Deltaproteobacteria bacterium]